jgi:hypothetical protein
LDNVKTQIKEVYQGHTLGNYFKILSKLQEGLGVSKIVTEQRPVIFRKRLADTGNNRIATSLYWDQITDRMP